jgi:lipoate-protein ligase A
MIEAAPFGPGPLILVQDALRRSGSEDMDLVHRRLAALAGGGRAEANVSVPSATAAFSRLDSKLPGYPDAREALVRRGYEPIIRPVGGHLAVYGPGDLVVHLWGPHPSSRAHIRERFLLFGEALSAALRTLGVDARIGPVPGEYCSGEYSVNGSGTVKLAGTGQRLTKHGYLFSAVVMVEEADGARRALEEAYSLLGLRLVPESVGCVADSVPGVTTDEIRQSLAFELQRLLPPDTAMLATVPFSRAAEYCIR